MNEKIRKHLANLTPKERSRLLAKLGSNSGENLINAEPAVSYQQEYFWTLHQLLPENSALNCHLLMRITGKLNTDALKEAVYQVVRHNNIYQTTYSERNGKPKAIFNPELLPSFSVHEETPPPQNQFDVSPVIKEQKKIPFDLTKECLIRVLVMPHSGNSHTISFMFHHIVCDGGSWNLFWKDLVGFYQNVLSGKTSQTPESNNQYIVFANKQKARRAINQDSHQYWTQLLQGLPEFTFPTDRNKHVSEPNIDGCQLFLEIEPAFWEAIIRISKEESCSLHALLMSIFFAWHYKYFGMEDLVIATPINTRMLTGDEQVQGCTINMLPIREQMDGQTSIRSLIQSVSQHMQEAFEHFDESILELTNHFANEDSRSGEIYTSVFQIRNIIDEFVALDPSGKAESLICPRQSAQNPIMLEVHPNTNKPLFALTFDRTLISTETANVMLNSFFGLLNNVVADREVPLNQTSLLTTDEYNKIVNEWNATTTAYPREQCVHELFEEQVKKTPDSIAVVFEEESLTYRQLDERSNHMANHLFQQGLASGDLAGVCLERSADMIIALLAIWKTGAAYVPLDPTYPIERIRMILEDAQPNLLLTKKSLLAGLVVESIQIVCLDDEESGLGGRSNQAPDRTSTANDLAYVIFTSGSTGRPKGVEIEHRSVVNLLQFISLTPGFTNQDTMLAVATICFDISVAELFLPLVTGGRLVVAHQRTVSDGEKLRSLLESSKVTFMLPTPVTWRMLLEAGWKVDPDLTMISTGEALPEGLADSLVSKGGNLWNFYGPTETTVWSTCCKVDNPNDIHIGKPIANTQVYMFDANLQPVPIGVSGEFMIGGDGLARGYLGNPEMTAEKFIPNPFRPGEKMYRTGDLARWRSDGQIEFLGRIDNQVKVRGFRIELGEIETALAKIESIKSCAVIVSEDASEDKRLVAYYEVKSEQVVDVESLRKALKEQLPDYMVPSMFIQLDEIPLTPNGKIDRKKLEKQEVVFESFNEYVAPRNAIEQKLATIWTEMLKIEKIGIHNNFFDLGGHSLLAMRVQSCIREAFEVDISIRDLFEFPTIKKLAGQIEILRVPDAIRQEREQGAL